MTDPDITMDVVSREFKQYMIVFPLMMEDNNVRKYRALIHWSMSVLQTMVLYCDAAVYADREHISEWKDLGQRMNNYRTVLGRAQGDVVHSLENRQAITDTVMQMLTAGDENSLMGTANYLGYQPQQLGRKDLCGQVTEYYERIVALSGRGETRKV